MGLLLDAVYLLLILVLSPWFAFQSLRTGKYRSGFAQKFCGAVPERNGNRPCLWLHGVSVGEVNLLGVLLNQIESRWPDIECVISTTTRTGYELALKKYTPRCVFYCPLDFTWATRRALRRIRPQALLLAELELWPNLLAEARRQGVRTMIVNGRLSERSARGYGRVRRLMRGTLGNLDRIGAQTEEYARRFSSLGARSEQLLVTGSLKFEGVETNRDNRQTRELRQLAGLRPDDIVFLAGSTSAPEEELALNAFQQLAPDWPKLKWVVVPRHPERFAEVAALLDRAGLAWQRRSELDAQHSADPSTRVLLVDTVGELRAWWGVADIGFVGGSFGARGGQSMIEPAAYGVAVAFGPRTHNFREVVEMLLAEHAGRVVHSNTELTQFVRECLMAPQDAREMGQRAQRLIQRQAGAAETTMRALEELLRGLPCLPRRAA